MKVFTKRNAFVGALVTWVARKRIERKLNKLAGHAPRRRRLLMGAGVVTSVAVAVGALLARRSSPPDAQVA
jgi:type II secretory pathway component PulM